MFYSCKIKFNPSFESVCCNLNIPSSIFLEYVTNLAWQKWYDNWNVIVWFGLVAPEAL
jgi:hypothetical protein